MGTNFNAVKHLRDTYDIMQKELICTGISRPYLSNLENDKVEISHEMAYRIAEKFNEVFDYKSINLRLDKEDLMSSRRLLNKLKLNEELAYYEKIDNIDDAEIRAFEERYLIVESPYEYARLNSLLGNYYFFKKNYNKAIHYLVKAFDAFVSKNMIEDGMSLLSKMIQTYMNLEDYRSALAYDNYFFIELENNQSRMSKRLIEKFCYNSAQLNRKLGNYNIVKKRIEAIELLELYANKSSEKVLVLQVDCYLAQHEYDEAVALIDSLIASTTDRTIRMQTLLLQLNMFAQKKLQDDVEKSTNTVFEMLEDQVDNDEGLVEYYLSVLATCVDFELNELISKYIASIVDAIRIKGTRQNFEHLITLLGRIQVRNRVIDAEKAKLIDYYFGF